MIKVLAVGLTENTEIRGVERYAIELLRYITSGLVDFEVTLVCGSWQKYFQPLQSERLKIKVLKIKNSTFYRHMWHLFVMPYKSKGYDLVHLLNVYPVVHAPLRPTVSTIHDLAEFYVPEKYSMLQVHYRKMASTLAAKLSTHIITDSLYSKKSINFELGISCDKISSIYLGVEHFLELDRNDKVTCAEYEAVGAEYVLCWGVLERSKGIIELIYGFNLYKDRSSNSNLMLVIAGKAGNAYDELSQYFEQEDIMYLGHVSDDQIIFLASNATAVCFASKYEGFGFPALEGFIFCDNVIASNSTSLGEITRKFAWQVDPCSSSEIASAISYCISTPKVFTSAEREKILRDFSWHECALSTAKVYAKLLSS